MKGAVDKLVEWAKALPGFGLVFLIATLGQTYLKVDGKEPSVKDTLLTTIVCWVLYQAAAYLDKLYDAVYGPKSKWDWMREKKRRFLWGFDALREARDNAASALLRPVDEGVTDYASATASHHIGDPPLPSLYSLCKLAAKPTEVWRQSIAPKIDVSKAARTVFAFAVIGILLVEVVPLQELTGAGPYLQRLRFAATPAFLISLAVVSLVIYVVLRVLHNLALFSYVATDVTHIPVNKRKAAVIFDVVLGKAEGA